MAGKYEVRDTDLFLVVDVQNDFCPGGALEVPEGDRVVGPINGIAKRFRHVIQTQDWHTPDHWSFASTHEGKAPFETIEMDYGPQILWPDHCVQGTEGAAFHPDLRLTRSELIIRKGYNRRIDSYSAFFENDRETPTGLAGYLRERGLDRVFVAGLALDVCVRYSAEDAKKLGFPAVVLEDACRAIDMDGSLDETKQALRDLDIPLIPTDRLG